MITWTTLRVYAYIVGGCSTLWMWTAFISMMAWGHSTFLEPNVYVATFEMVLTFTGVWAIAMIAVKDFVPRLLVDQSRPPMKGMTGVYLFPCEENCGHRHSGEKTTDAFIFDGSQVIVVGAEKS